MRSVFGMGLLAIVAALSMGCAANAKCVRDVNDLQAQSIEQDRQIRDLQGRLAVVQTEQAGTTLSSLATEGWAAATAAFGWAKAEAPVAYHDARQAYDATAARMQAARDCYAAHGGNRSDLTFDDYKRIATACLNAQ